MQTDRMTDQERTAQEVEQIIVLTRLSLYGKAVPCGPKAIRVLMDTVYNIRPLPSLKTIATALSRNGLTYGRTGWYPGDEPSWLPESAKRRK